MTHKESRSFIVAHKEFSQIEYEVPCYNKHFARHVQLASKNRINQTEPRVNLKSGLRPCRVSCWEIWTS